MAQLQQIESDVSYPLTGRPGKFDLVEFMFGSDESMKAPFTIKVNGVSQGIRVQVNIVWRIRNSGTKLYAVYGLLCEKRPRFSQPRWVAIHLSMTNDQGRVIVTDEMPIHLFR